MKKIRPVLSLSFLLCLFLVMTNCALVVKPSVEPQLKELTVREARSHDLQDDLDLGGLEQAVAQSAKYYRRLPQNRSFHYADLIYSPEELAESLDLFMMVMKNYHGKERMQQLREKFLFFESINSEHNAFFTGYYEPTLEGNLIPTEEFTQPLYNIPDDLIEVDLGQFSEKWKNEKIIGRLKGTRLVPYDSRDKIVYDNSLEGRAETIAYVKEIELFFLQIQGSGLIKLPGGEVMRVNYAGSNGHPYRAVGTILKDKIPPDRMSLQAIKEYLYSHPDEVKTILSYNQSYIFFREMEEGPLGNIGVPLTQDRSIAMDWRVIPGGSLAYIETELPVFDDGRIIDWKPVKRFVLVQDTGGVIRDHGRVDIFFGNGEKAELTAGHLKQKGRVFIIVARKEFL
ncbi:MAG: MltA domain-containing protein [Nitrospirae bacterium]|nr:MltA domain-containing protein [Nitrospirota bacterium]